MASTRCCGPALWLMLGMWTWCVSGAAATRPNIVIILTDDSGYADLGCYGGEIETPNIDKIGRGGLRFASFYTNARCSPTRATLLTGRDCALAGFGAGTLGQVPAERPLPAYRARLASHLPTIAERLRDAGYHTMMAGKWHLGGRDIRNSPRHQADWKRAHPGWELTPAEIEAEFGAMPAQRGFNDFFGMIGGETDFFFLPNDKHNYLAGNEPATLTYDRTYTIEAPSHKKGGAGFPHHGKTSKAFYDTDGITERAMEMIRDHLAGSEKPFFLYLAYRAPHAPLQAPRELVEKYLPRYANFQAIASNRVAGLIREKLLPPGSAWEYDATAQGDPSDFQRSLAIHAAMVEKVDENVGRLLAALKQRGVLDHTLVFYLSDNGSAPRIGYLLNKPYSGAKGLLWEGGAKTHCIAYWPRHIQPGRITTTVGWVGDLMSTCLELAGAPPVLTEGRSLVPVLSGEEMPPPEYLFFNDGGQQSVIHKGRWKLLINPGWYVNTRKNPGTTMELYDLQNDPTETSNLAAHHPEMVRDLAAQCEQWQKKCGLVDYAEIFEQKKIRDP